MGLASFVLGLLAVFLITKDDVDGGSAGGADTVEVLVAGADLEAGTSGEDLLRNGDYDTERIARADLTADNLTAPSQLSGTVLTLRFAAGEPLRVSGLRSLGNSVRPPIPEGFEAVATTTDFVAGGASSVIPGDRVNVYLNIRAPVEFTVINEETGAEQPSAGPYATGRTELLLANTLVLDVQVGTTPLQVGQPTDGTAATATATVNPSSLTFVLAVDTLDAEKVIFASTQVGSQLYLSRVRLDDDGNPPPPIASTPGQDFFTILNEEALAAFTRTNPTP
ncbi:MAG: hypothetical protein H0W25_19980 [Acidimicrobiia bacterium]|nr:hypothetical protein [Acidimicrobiia bacterium]